MFPDIAKCTLGATLSLQALMRTTDLGREQPSERGPLNINDLIWDFPIKTNLRV